MSQSKMSHPIQASDVGFLSEGIDQSARARIMIRRSTRLIKLCLDFLGQTLAKLNSPLIKAVYIPDGALDEGEMFVIRNQRPEGGRCDFLGQDRRRRPVA